METVIQKTQLQKIDKANQRITLIYPITDLGSIVTEEGIDIQEALNSKAPIESPTFTGTPKAPTPASDDVSTQIATTAFVKAAVEVAIEASDAMVFKGTLGIGGTVTSLPANHHVGDTYKVITPGTYAGYKCEIGDMIICITRGTVARDSDWVIVQSNLDGAVIGPDNSTDLHVAIFNGATGKIIKDSGYTIQSSVPANAVFTDTTYEPVTQLVNGLMTALDKIKLDSIEASAQVNVIEDIYVNNVKQSVSSKGVNITVPTELSDLNNTPDGNGDYFVKTNTTGLKNYFTKTATTEEIRRVIGTDQVAMIRKVNQLPATGQTNILYLVPKTDSVTSNAYYEYLWCLQDDGTTYAWERIGDTEIDLEGDFVSATKSQSFTDSEKAQARANIDAVSQEVYIGSTQPNQIPLWINLSGDAYNMPEERYVIEVNSTDTSVTKVLMHNHDIRYTQNMTSLVISIPDVDYNYYRAKLTFKTGASAPSFTASSIQALKFIGDDCNGGIFTPVKDNTYTIDFYYNGIEVRGYVVGTNHFENPKIIVLSQSDFDNLVNYEENCEYHIYL